MKALNSRSWIVVAVLAVLWLLGTAWQVIEHRRVRTQQRQALLTHARDIAMSLEVVLRSQARLATVSRDRLEAALEALSQSSELRSLALINPHGKIVSAAGAELPAGTGDLPPGTQLWEPDTLTVVELLQLTPLTPREDEESGTREVVLVDRFPGRPPRPRPSEDEPGRDLPGPPDARENGREPRPDLPPPLPPRERVRPEDGEVRETPPAEQAGTADVSMPATDSERASADIPPEARSRFDRWLRRHSWGGQRPRYPPWLSEAQFRAMFDEFGLHRFVLILSSREVDAAVHRDLMQRLGLVVLASLAVIALGIGARAFSRATELQLRLVRAQEVNAHLREMNTAAAGLAHETRNPLNAMRGLAQLIAGDGHSSADSRQHAQALVAEVDRVNSRLGEFIAFSRPRTPAPSAVNLANLARDVAGTLDVDRDEKSIELDLDVPDREVLADSGQLRQTLFNLLLNAYQAVPEGGKVRVFATRQDDTFTLHIADNGPGVPAHAREDIFRAYFTLSEKGTGLGLAIVRQIVLAHNWDIVYCEASGGGAEFRIRGIKPV